MQNTNEELIVKLLRKATTRREAFAKLVEDFTTPLYWQIRRMVLSHDDANDILQNVFMKAWQNIESFRADSKLSTWLYRICVNETLTFLNKNQTNQNIEEVEEEVKEQLLSDEYFDGDEIQIKFAQALETLPARQREVFNLKYFQEMKYEEISEILGTSVGSLKASYHIAVEKISKILSDED